MPHAARNWSEAGALLCEVLAAELAHLRQAAAQETPPASGSSQDRPQPPPQASVQLSAGGPEPSRDGGGTPTKQHVSSETTGEKRHAPKGSDSTIGAARQPAAEDSSRSSKRARVAEPSREASRQGRPGAAQWPDVLQNASAQKESPSSKRPRKSVPEPPSEFAAGVCAAWAALCAPCEPAADSLQGRYQCPSHSFCEGANGARSPPEEPCEASGREESVPAHQLCLDACPELSVLAGPAGFLSCSQPPAANQELRQALQKQLNGSGKNLGCCSEACHPQ